MVDEKLLDQMNFGELSQSLDYVLEKIGKYEDERYDERYEPLLDMLYVLANKIVVRMDEIVRSSASPSAIAQWEKLMPSYKEHFERFTDLLLEEDTLLDVGRPKRS